ncbi:hypothetical protein BH10PLA2_BH10PLA2_13990 [soil metagenome]
MKKLFSVIVLGSLVVVGCDKPASTASKITSKTPVIASPGGAGDTMKAKPEADKKAADDAAAKKAADDAAAKKAADAKKPDPKK